MNCISRSSVGAGAGVRGGSAPDPRGIYFAARRTERLQADVAAKSADRRAGLPKFIPWKLDMLERIDLMKSSANCPKFSRPVFRQHFERLHFADVIGNNLMEPFQTWGAKFFAFHMGLLYRW